jgi:hypothetical protein
VAQPYDPYSGVTYFNNKVANAPYLSELGITQEEMERLTQETLAWKFYNGDQWNYKRPGGEPQVTLNYCRAFVDKSVAFLMAKGFTIQVKEEAEDITKPLF